MTETEYRALDAVNWSRLKLMGVSPLHYRSAPDNPRPDTDALAAGRLVDTLVFTPEIMGSRYIVSPYDDYRTKAAQAWRDAAQADGLEPVKADAVAEATALARAVRAHPTVASLLDGGAYQRPMVWRDPRTGLLCKGLPDLVHARQHTVADLKTGRSIQLRKFLSDALKYGYPCQLAHYGIGVEVADGWRPEHHLMIVAEKGRPYDVGVIELSQQVMADAHHTLAAYMDRVVECEQARRWPGQYETPIRLVTADDFPRWYADDSEDVTIVEED